MFPDIALHAMTDEPLLYHVNCAKTQPGRSNDVRCRPLGPLDGLLQMSR